MAALGGPGVVRMALILSTIYAVGGYVLFVAIFDTRFPAGPVERAIQAVTG